MDGKQQEAHDLITVGKNHGQKNETTPQQQAIAEAKAKWEKQRNRRHYGLTVENVCDAVRKALA